MHTTGWSKGLDVTAGGQGIVSHAGLALLRALEDKTGLTGGLSRTLATPRLLVHDRGRVLADRGSCSARLCSSSNKAQNSAKANLYHSPTTR